MKKADCRTFFSSKRAQLSKQMHRQLSGQIVDQIAQHIPLSGKTISLFLPILQKHEIDTYPILLDGSFKNYRVALPIADFTSNSMQHILFEHLNQLKVNPYGIPEPISGEQIDVQEIDLVFVPLLCVDAVGQRVGYGKGFYDRFLENCRKECQFIGLSLFEPIDVIEDVNPTDIPLHACVTPNGIYKFNDINSF